MTNEEYRALPRISNSDLTNIKGLLFGIPKPPLPQNAFNFGTVIHEAVLEPHLNSPVLQGVDYELVSRIINECEINELLQFVLMRSEKEKVVLWEKYGLPLKSKLDIIFNGSEVWDLKTTSCSSKQAFEKSCIEYNYYRQGAFYLDSINGQNFTFVGISKTAKKNPIFFVRMTPEMIKLGRLEYESLLKFWKNNNLKLPNT